MSSGRQRSAFAPRRTATDSARRGESGPSNRAATANAPRHGSGSVPGHPASRTGAPSRAPTPAPISPSRHRRRSGPRRRCPRAGGRSRPGSGCRLPRRRGDGGGGCSPRERAGHAAVPPGQRRGVFVRLGVCRGAYAKAAGIGLPLSPDWIEVRTGPGPRDAILVDGAPPSGRWHARTVADGGQAGARALSGERAPVRQPRLARRRDRRGGLR